MFTIAVKQRNPITKEPALWFYSPRCSLCCRDCIVPFKTQTDYTKLDIVPVTERYRNEISSLVLYLGNMTQKPHIIIKYLNVFKSRWPGLKRYIAFAVPSLGYLWKYFTYNLADGLIFDLHAPAVVPRSGKPPLMKETCCNERQFIQALILLRALETDPKSPPHVIRVMFDPRRYKANHVKEWMGWLKNTFPLEMP